MRYDLPIERTAAVIHLQTALMASRLLHGWVAKLAECDGYSRPAQGDQNAVEGCQDVSRHQKRHLGNWGVQHRCRGCRDL